MRGRTFLELAREIVTGNTEVHWRGAAIHAYYAAFLESRDALTTWGVTFQPKVNVHGSVRLRFTYATNPDLKRIANFLDDLAQDRNRASYDLTSSTATTSFASSGVALKTIQTSADALALLDAIEADPARKATAVASFPP